MPPRKASRRVDVVKAFVERFGLGELADVQAHLVRERPVPPRLLSRLVGEEDGVLTQRQREIMVLLATGFTRQEIGRELGISEQTVKSHLRDIYGKLDAHNRVEAINAFIEEAA